TFHLPGFDTRLCFIDEAFQKNLQHLSSQPLGSDSAPRQAEAAPGFHQSMVRNGLALDLTINQVRSGKGNSLTPGDMRIRFRVRDTETGSPLTGLHPSAWMSLLRGNPDVSCKTTIKSFLSGGPIGQQPDVDMNAYYVAVLNQDASITVVDPQFSS